MELTPREGDRVIVPKGASPLAGETVAGYVNRIDPCIRTDAQVQTDRGSWIWVSSADLTVVDREPVKWPEGWSKSGNDYVVHRTRRQAVFFMCRDELEQILATGPDMLARWDELMGES